jgi:hypothetical protein
VSSTGRCLAPVLRFRCQLPWLWVPARFASEMQARRVVLDGCISLQECAMTENQAE